MRWSFATIALVPRGTWIRPSHAEQRGVFERAAALGFQGVELSSRWLAWADMSEYELRRLRSDLDSLGLAVSALNVSRCIMTRTDRAASHYNAIQGAIDVAARLGSSLVNVSFAMPTLPGPGRPAMRGSDADPEEHARTVDFVSTLADHADRHSIELSIELHDDGLLDTPEACLHIVRAVRRRNVGVNPDVGNICRGQGPLPDWRRALAVLAARANNWHVKNYRAGRPAPAWDGDIDYREAVVVMREAGYGGWVAFETYETPDVFTLQAETLAWMRAIAADVPTGVQGAAGRENQG